MNRRGVVLLLLAGGNLAAIALLVMLMRVVLDHDAGVLDTLMVYFLSAAFFGAGAVTGAIALLLIGMTGYFLVKALSRAAGRGHCLGLAASNAALYLFPIVVPLFGGYRGP